MTPPPSLQVRDAATAWINSGVSVVPVGTAKRPTVRWEPFQAAAPTLDQAQQWWGNGRLLGYAIICGQISGNLEMTELEAAAMSMEAQGKLFDTLDSFGDVGYDLYNVLWYGYRQHSPSGGVHLAYRISDHPVPGNEKIARRPATPEELEARPGNRFVVLAETRGEGGYFIGAGSPGICHPSGQPWVLHHGELGEVPTITWEQRQLWHEILRTAFNEIPAEPPRPIPPTQAPVVRTDGLLSPGDDYENRTPWEDILEPHGWQIESVRGQEIHWTRPGKNPRDGMSATTGHANDRNRLFVFSSATEFEPERPYTKFAAYTVLNHGGDSPMAFQAATRELARQGFGDPLPPPPAADLDFMGNAIPSSSSSSSVAVIEEEPARKPFYRWDDDGNAMRLRDRIKDRSRYVPEMKDWMRFDGKKWVEDAEAQAAHLGVMAVKEEMYREADAEDNEELRKFAKSLGSNSRRNAAVATATKLPELRALFREFDQRRDLVNLPNMMLNPATREELPHDPSLLMTRLFGTSYDPSAAAPTWDRYLSDVLPDQKMREYVRRAVGYTLTANPNQRSLFFLYGGSGTGKSTFLEVMRALFGDYGVTVASSTFRKKRNSDGPTPDLHTMRGKRFVSTSETVTDSEFEEDLLKRLSGGDSVTSRELYAKPVEWSPECVLWMATNFVPQFTQEDDAIWRRAKLIPFTTQFDGDREDQNLKAKLLAELPGILNWVLDGVRDYLDNGLGEPAEIAQQVQEHREMGDQVVRFITDVVENAQVELGDDRSMRTSSLYAVYRDWVRDNGERLLGTRRFNMRMQAILGSKSVKRGGQMHWDGISLAGGWVTGSS